jgi:release factor glutamine methyltransferase
MFALDIMPQDKLDNSIASLIANTNIERQDTKLILCHMLNFTRVQLITHNDYVLSNAEIAEFQELCRKCQLGMPINYITGWREFYSREFKVTPDTLIPRPETELLVDNIIHYAKPGLSLLDLGTGSGCIAISAKLEFPELNVCAVDKFAATLEIAKYNAANLGAQIEFKLSDWLSGVSGKYDIIVSNPPYIHPDDDYLAALSYEPQLALTDFNDGLDCLRNIISAVPNYLNYNGILMVEHGFDQGEAVRKLFATAGFSNIKTILDYSKHERITFAMMVG